MTREKVEWALFWLLLAFVVIMTALRMAGAFDRRHPVRLIPGTSAGP